MKTRIQDISATGGFRLHLLKTGMVLSLAGGICFFLFACGSPKGSDGKSAADSTSLSTDSITTISNGADTTVALDSAGPVIDTSHR